MSAAPDPLVRLPLLIAALCTACDATLLVVVEGPPLDGVRPWLVLALFVAADLALAAPIALTAAVVAAHALLRPAAVLLLGEAAQGEVIGSVGFLVAGYLAGAFLTTGRAAVALAVLLGGALSGEVLLEPTSGAEVQPILSGVYLLSNVLVPWLVGRYTTTWRDHLAELRRRDELRVADELAAVERAVAQDRSAIARDLHDVVSHHVSAITVHAGAARLALPAGPGAAAARRSVGVVESAGRAATEDLRRLLDLLHGDDPGERQPGVDNLDELVDGVRRAGLDLRLDTAGPVGAVPASVGVVVYRLVQEALTNALRHGSGGPVRVGVRRDAATLGIVVTNPVGGPARPAGRGRGMPGMRTRAGLFGGRVSAGPVRGGREWEVRVDLPVEGS